MKNYIIQNILPIRFLSEEEESTDSIKLSLETLILSLMLIIYITSGPLLKKSGVKILHASGFTMIIGFVFTFIIKIIFTNSNFFKGFQFNRNLFFTFILPWIIFSAGYNLKIESFLKYFRYIILFSFSEL
jgi:NhaP-type Na+/H+ or K+/H+ antiporter